MRLEPRDRIGLAVAFVIAGGCVAMGRWQLARLHQRRTYNATVRAIRARAPLNVAGSLPLDSARERRLRARGLYDYARQRFWRPRSYEGIPGVDLITPLRLADGAAVLVDRGWAPSPDAYHVDQEAYRESDSAEVMGIGLVAPRGRGDVDPRVLRDSLPYPLLPFVLQQLPSDRLTVRPALTRWPAPELTDGPHLSYAIQWFSFAVIAVVGSLALARKRAGEAEVTHK